MNEKAISYYADTTIFKCIVAGALVELSAEYVKFFFAKSLNILGLFVMYKREV